MMLTALGLMAQHGEVPPPAAAQEEAPRRQAGPPQVGHLVTVPLPITGNSDQSVRKQLARVIENHSARGDGRPAIVVLEFGKSEDQTGEGSEFGRCYDLAKFLLSDDMQSARTVAYIPHRLEGHALLVAMACQEIVMHEDAELGRSGGDSIQVGRVEREAYEDIFAQRQTLPAALAIGMLDGEAEVLRATVKDGSRWVYAEQLTDVEQQPGYTGYETIVKRGEVGSFNAGELRGKYGIVSRKVSDRADLAAQLGLGKLSDDPLLAAKWHAIRVDLIGGLNERLATESIRAVQDKVQSAEAVGDPVNFLCVKISSPGGITDDTPADAIAIIGEIDALRREGIYVAAYIPSEARSDAAIIAMACDSIQIEPDAKLGGSGPNILNRDQTDLLVDRIKLIARDRGIRWSQWAAMVDRDLVVHEYTRKGAGGGGQVAYFCEEELNEQRNADQWVKGASVSDDSSLMIFDGTKAVELGLADNEVDSFAGFQREFGLENAPELVERNWVHLMIDAMKENCCIPYLLLFMGCSAFLSEISAPGVGVPGFVALVCFMLFFWLQFLKGDATSLEILLFIGGVLCIAAEIFVIPGFGIFGLGGGAMVIVSIVLASQTWVIPRNEYQLERLPYSLLSVIAAGAGVFVGILLMRRYADRAPGLRGVMLAPPDEQEKQEVSRRESLADFAHLQGKRGTAATQLTPSGKARFGDDLVDVMTDGEVVEKGAAVVVVGVQANVVMVESLGE